MRAFLGVPLPRLEGLARLLDRLKETGADLKLGRAEQFHLTLLFLGEVREELAAAFVRVLRGEVLPPPFDLAVRDVGAFPDWRRLRVAWAGIEDPAGGLTTLHAAAEHAWTGLGQASEDRAFQPHLTLARRRSDRGLDAARTLLQGFQGLAFGTAHVDRVNLYRSTLTPAGPQYAVVEAVTL